MQGAWMRQSGRGFPGAAGVRSAVTPKSGTMEVLRLPIPNGESTNGIGSESCHAYLDGGMTVWTETPVPPVFGKEFSAASPRRLPCSESLHGFGFLFCNDWARKARPDHPIKPS